MRVRQNHEPKTAYTLTLPSEPLNGENTWGVDDTSTLAIHPTLCDDVVCMCRLLYVSLGYFDLRSDAINFPTGPTDSSSSVDGFMCTLE